MMQRNPFSTCFTRPGKIPFVFPEGQDVDSLLNSLAEPRSQRAIVEPHGSGKSTLLETLSAEWSKRGLTEQRVQLTASRRNKAIAWSLLNDQSVLVIDGLEQLPSWRRWWIQVRCRQRECRLLVTCHVPCGVPVILRTKPEWPLAFELVQSLLPCDATAYQAELKELWDENPGNIRDYLFRLYHWCESRGVYRLHESFHDRHCFSK